MVPSRHGNAHHRAVLRAFLAHFEQESNWLFLGLFGSLARGNWTDDSDVDLDVVIANGNAPAVAEVKGLEAEFDAEGDPLALAIPDGVDSAKAILRSLTSLSVRFHPLLDTSPNIIDSLRPLASRIDPEAVIAAGRSNVARRGPPAPLRQWVDQCLIDCLEVSGALHRGRLWLALELLARARGRLMGLYAQANGGVRAAQFFEANAPPALQARLGATLPGFSAAAAKVALGSVLDLLERGLAEFAPDAAPLSPAQTAVLSAIRHRMA